MERKIGEIFEYNGEWYQCINTGNCSECAFTGKRCYDFSTKGVDIIGDCSGRTFKKLEKVGEPYSCNYYGDARLVMMQEYQLFDENVTYCYSMPPMFVTDYKHKRIAIEIKVNKKDMEEKDIKPYDKIFSEGTVSNTGNLVTSSLKPFDLEAAKAGKPVCTRDGRKARIICFDRVTNTTNEYTGHLIVLVTNPNGDEQSFYYTEKGNLAGEDEYDNHKYDLMMLSEKKEGWVNVYYDNDASSHRGCRYIYDTKERAVKEAGSNYITTVKINWEE